MEQLYTLAKARLSASNPDQAAQLDFKQSEILRGQIERAKQDQQDMTDMRNTVADGYKLIGATDFAQQIVASKPSDADMFVCWFRHGSIKPRDGRNRRREQSTAGRHRREVLFQDRGADS